MLGKCEKMVIICPSTTNEWPQIDEKSLMPSTGKVMEKRAQEQILNQQPPPQQTLKCPRCDSSNTKFCYYNNYSLSQPRHFCKACKRYWTRGGTLRNVPVGGGCRKNKRVKRPTSAAATTIEGAGNHPSQTQIDISSSTNHINPLFYGLPTNPSLAFPGRFNSSIMDSISGFDHLQSLGLGFSSNNNSVVFNPSKQIQDSSSTTSTSLLSKYSNIFGSCNNSNSTATASPTMATLLASNQQQKLSMKDGPNNNLYQQSLTCFEDFQNNESGMKEVKIEQEHNHRMEWNIPCGQNQIDPIGIGFSTTSDPSSFYWNTTTTNSVGARHDPGSSLTSLI